MKRKNISETIDNISPKYIDEATEYTGAKKTMSKYMWHKWVAVAACFALVLALGFPFVKDLLITSDQKDIVDSIMLIEYDDSYLEIIEDDKSIKKFGLPSDITEDIIGNHIAYLQKDVPEAERTLENAEQENIDLKSFLSVIRQCTDLQELTPALVNRLISKIEIFDSCKDENGKKHVPIKVHFIGVGILQIPDAEMIMELKEEIRKEATKVA